MKIILPGGSGQVGTILARAFHSAGHEVVVLSRHQRPAPWRWVGWDAQTLGDWTAVLDGADVVINLAGRSVNCRYTEQNRRLILESRVRSTQLIGEAIAQLKRPPHTWLQASTATIYAHRYDGDNDEAGGILGGQEANVPAEWRFSTDVAKAWEAAANEAEVPETRRVILRSAMIMSPDRGGIFDTLLWLVRMGLGGSAGDGRQYVSWIHHQDFIRAISWLIEDQEFHGAINLAAPGPLPYRDFMRALRQAWGRKVGLPATVWMLRIGAFILRTEPELVLKSRRVVPGRLLQAGFVFKFPTWPEAAQELCQAWRAARQTNVTVADRSPGYTPSKLSGDPDKEA